MKVAPTESSPRIGFFLLGRKDEGLQHIGPGLSSDATTRKMSLTQEHSPESLLLIQYNQCFSIDLSHSSIVIPGVTVTGPRVW
jgi:hypothetical protein